jgi:hypothetical protein
LFHDIAERVLRDLRRDEAVRNDLLLGGPTCVAVIPDVRRSNVGIGFHFMFSDHGDAGALNAGWRPVRCRIRTGQEQ